MYHNIHGNKSSRFLLWSPSKPSASVIKHSKAQQTLKDAVMRTEKRNQTMKNQYIFVRTYSKYHSSKINGLCLIQDKCFIWYIFGKRKFKFQQTKQYYYVFDFLLQKQYGKVSLNNSIKHKSFFLKSGTVYVNTTQDFSLKKKQLLSKLITKVATYTNFVALYDSFRTTTVISAEFVWL